MVDVQFFESDPKLDKDKFYKSKPSFGAKLVDFIIKYSGGLIKNENQAQYVILALVAAIIIFSFILVISSFSSPITPANTQILPAEF